MIQWSGQACIDGKPAPLASCRGMVTWPTNVKYALSENMAHFIMPLLTGRIRVIMDGANKEVFRRFYERAWNMGDVAIVDELLAPTFVNHEVTDTSRPHQDLYKQAIIETRTAFPDWTTTIDDVIAEGDIVAARWRSQGTHTGMAWGQEPTGKQIDTIGMTFVRVVNGKITDFWKQDNAYIARQQLADAAKESA